MLGLDENQWHILKSKYSKLPRETEHTKARKAGMFTAQEASGVEDLNLSRDHIVKMVTDNWNNVSELYNDMNPEKHRMAIHDALILKWYILEPNVRNAICSLMFKPNDPENDNYVIFDVTGKAVIIWNKLKTEGSTPLVHMVSDEMTKDLKKYKEEFGHIGNPYVFVNDDKNVWNSDSFTKRITKKSKELFGGKVGSRMLRIWQFMLGDKACLSPAERKEFAMTHGQSYRFNQMELYAHALEQDRVQ